MPGPAPKFDPVRRNARSGPLKLPAEGRTGPTPEWPLEGFTGAEASAWESLWRTPQAVAWERLGWVRTVARFCRVMVRAEDLEASPALVAQAVVLEDRLGLNPKAMRLLLWEITSDEVSEKRQVKGARGRIKAVG